MDRQAEPRQSAMSTTVGSLDRSAPVYIAGHRGLVGSALVRRFQAEGFTDLLVRQRSELDLTDRAATFDFIRDSRPQVVIDAAARVGGILANSTYPADFLSENLQIQVNLLDAATAARVPRLLFLGSSCIYPKLAPQPIPESALLTGPLSQPTMHTRSPRSPASFKYKRLGVNTGCGGSLRCQPTCTDRVTTFPQRDHTCCPRSSAATTKPKPVGRRK